MTPEQAEARIVELVQTVIDRYRGDDSPEAKRAIEDAEAEILELKKITGPRRIVGSMRL